VIDFLGVGPADVRTDSFMTKPAKHFYATTVAAIWALVAAREQIYLLLKDSKWIIAVSLLVAAILGLPDQSKELYRIA
jgi:hypothetical protein